MASWLAAGLALGCAPSPRAPSDTAPDVAWVVRVGSQGGFTGGASGYLVHADGTVQSFSRVTPDDTMSLQTVGRAGAGEIDALRLAIADPALVRVELHETGNLTAFLEWTAGGERRAFSWGETVADPVLPDPLQKALQATRAAIDSARR